MRWLAATAMGLALLAAACSSGDRGEPGASGTPAGGQPSGGEELTRVDEAGGVTIEATWLREGGLTKVDADLSQYPLDQFVLLEIDFTTHSGDLSKIDMERAALLRQGGTETQPEAWVSASDDAHHRAGVLVFPRELRDGPVELVLTIDRAERSFQWESAPGA